MFRRLLIIVTVIIGGTMSSGPSWPPPARHPVRPCPPGPSTPDAYAKAAGSISGLRAGDGWYSVPLSGGRIAWSFGDHLDDRDALIHNGVAIQCGQTWSMVRANYGELLPNDADGGYHWGGPMVQEGTTVWMFATRVNAIGGVTGTDLYGFDAVSWALTSMTSVPDGWGAGVLSGTWIYIYKTELLPGEFGNVVRVARVPYGQLRDFVAWRYWTGSKWSPDRSQASIILGPQPGPESGFQIHMTQHGYEIVSKKDGSYSDTVGVYQSPNPQGPFTFTPKFSLPQWTQEDQHYLALGHQELSSGKRLVSVSRNHTIMTNGQPDPWATLRDMSDHPERYRPTWHEVS